MHMQSAQGCGVMYAESLPSIWNNRWIGLAQSSSLLSTSTSHECHVSFSLGFAPHEGLALLVALGSPLHKSAHPSVHLFIYSSYFLVLEAVDSIQQIFGVKEDSPLVFEVREAYPVSAFNRYDF
jgi:hypothetical protein